jgi:ribosomal protein L30E
MPPSPAYFYKPTMTIFTKPLKQNLGTGKQVLWIFRTIITLLLGDYNLFIINNNIKVNVRYKDFSFFETKIVWL